MTGTIKFTSGNGGMIKPDNGDASIRFDWLDCEFGPKDVGHGVAVRFFVEVIGRRDRAIAVRRLESKSK